jgi:hypothetical protein
MRLLLCSLLLSLLLAAAPPLRAADDDQPSLEPGRPAAMMASEGPTPTGQAGALGVGTTLARDYAAFYSGRRLLTLGAAFATAGVVANTGTDEDLYGRYRNQREVRSDGWVAAAEPFGEGAVVLPAILVPALLIGLGERQQESLPGAWWRRSARAYAVGGPAFYYLQQITGGSRPGEPGGATWKPFVGNHGVSGHAFLGAVPLLTAARLSHHPVSRGAWILASTVPALARLERGQHFPSQVLLGWLLAWESTGAVAEASALNRHHWQLVPLAVEGGGGALVAVSRP